MGIFTASKLNRASRNLGTGITGIVSPWQDTSNLSTIVVSDLFGDVPQFVTRADALKVPAVAKGRAILHAVIATRPLIALDTAGKLTDQPSWLYRSDTGINPYKRMTDIIDDLIFDWASLLYVSRGSKDAILDAARVPFNRWDVDPQTNRVMIDLNGTGNLIEVDPDNVILIPGPGPGLLSMAVDSIVAARDTDRAWAQRVRNPYPAMILHETEDFGMTSKEAAEYVQAVAAARRNIDGAVMFLPHKIEMEAHPADTTDLFTAGRNAIRIDFANYLNLPASMLDGSLSTASLTYSTQEGKRNELFDYTIGYWTAPIEQALSMDNVVPRGQRIRFDFSDLLNTTMTPTGAPEED